MNEVLLSALVVMFEFTVTLLICGGVVGALYLRARQRDRKALEELTAKVRASRGERVERARKILKEKLRLADEKSEETANTVINTENALYKAVLTLYARRDSDALASFDGPVQQLVDAYLGLIESNGGALAGADTASGGDAQQLADLQAKNKALKEELNRLKQEMTTTVNEYASAFGGGHEGAEHVLEGEELSQEAAGDEPSVEVGEPAASAAAPPAEEKTAEPAKAETPAEAPAEAPAESAAPPTETKPKPGRKSKDDDEIDSILASLNIESFELGPEDDGVSADDAA